MVVVFGFQTVFGPKNKDNSRFPQDIGNKDVVEYSIDKNVIDQPSSPVSSKVFDLKQQGNEASFKEETISVSDKGFDVTFTNKGGNIQDIKISKYGYVALVNKFVNFKEFEDKAFRYNKISSTKHSMVYEGEGLEVSKNYILEQPFLVRVDIEIKNNADIARSISASTEFFNINLARVDKNVQTADWTLFEYSIKSNKRIIRKDNVNKFNDKWNKEESVDVEWIGFRDRYFATIVQPKKPFDKYHVKSNGETQLSLGGDFRAEIINPGQTKTYSFTIYLGPQNLDLLKQASPGFEKIMVFSNWGWLDAISKGIYWILGTLYKVIPSWGLCIILISLIIYGAMYPLTLKSLVSMKKMQALQPKMAELKKKHEKSPEKMNQEVMELYRRNGVNPLSGCLPMLLQMPIFVGLYQVLWRSFYFRGEGFLWIKDLSMPDQLFKLPFTIPFLGEYFNILPILMAIIMFFQQKMNMTNISSADSEQQQQQKMMLYFMPILMGFIFYNFASGLCVYFVVFYALSGYSQWKISKDMKAVV